MNRNEVLLNMRRDIIVFSEQLNSSISMLLFDLKLKFFASFTSLKMFKRFQLIVKEMNLLICSINIASFQFLCKKVKKNEIEIFAMSIQDINKKLTYHTQCYESA